MMRKEPEMEASMAQAPLLRTYAPFPFRMSAASGCMIQAEDGTEYLDLYGGHCVCLAGHSNAVVAAAVQRQMQRLAFYSTAGDLSIREEAASRLVDFIGTGMRSMFFVNSGAEANESALKVAVLLTGRRRFAYVEGSFHGRSLLALSVTDSSKLRAPFEQLLAPGLRLPLNDMPALMSADFSDVAAAIVEPIQSMAGVREASREWLSALEEKCRGAGSLLVCDEIQTGMGRLGAPTAASLHGIAPDIICLAKGIANGYPCAALMMTEGVARSLKPGDMGSTFGGGPAACAAMIATLDVIAAEGLMHNAESIGRLLAAELPGLTVTDVLGRGLLIGLRTGERASALKQHLFEQRILVGGSDNPGVLRLMPPLCLSKSEAVSLIDAVKCFDG